jgi:amino acid adenylation domain-containing protein
LSTHESKAGIVGFRLSPQQDRLLGAGDVAAVQCAATVAAGAREGDLRAALAEVVGRHEILRTTFQHTPGMRDRQQVVHDALALAWTSEEGTADGHLRDPDALAALLGREAERGFDLDGGPLLRAHLIATAGERGLLVLTAHGVVADGASLLRILQETAQGYRGGAGQEEPIQYADYAEWRHELVSGDEPEVADARRFWDDAANLSAATPRLLFSRTDAEASSRLVPVAVPLGDDEREAIAAAAERAGSTVPVFLEAAWHALIARLSGEGEVLMAGWFEGREQPDLEQAVGTYAQPGQIVTRFEPDTTFAEVLDQVRRAREEARRWEDYASARDLAELLDRARIAFVHTGVAALDDPILELAALTPPPGPQLTATVTTGPAGIQAATWYDPAAFSAQDADELAARFWLLLADAATGASRPVAELEIADGDERARLLAAAAGPRPEADAQTPVHHLFERVAQHSPDRVAVADASASLSYAELNAAANRIAHLLRDAGVGRGTRVGLCLEREPALLEALLGILKAGGAYVPLNYEHPPARITHQLAESEARVLVTQEHLLDRLPAFEGEIICVDRDRERIAVADSTDPERVSEPDDLVYVMYTSGSTGVPKGVAVTHGNLGNYATHIAALLGDGDGSGLRYGVASAISTDLGNTSIFPPLISGGSVQLISPDASMDGEAFAAELAHGPLDVLKITPSHLRALLAGAHGEAVLPHVRLVVGGEALSWELVEQIGAIAPECRVLNHYGPTEATIGCCAYPVESIRGDAATVPIGRPLAGVRAYVLDRALRPLPPGVPGELCIAGAGVAAGYVGPDREGEGPFVDDPFGAGSGRMYRTGDRARSLRDGTIEFLGRLDEQVKVRGFRIEPGEIEAVLARHSAIRQAAVVPERDDRGEIRLMAYISASDEPSVEELQAFLGESLPDYMVPASFATLDALPFTPSGKIDRKALAGIAAVETRREAEFIAPRDALEEEIAGIWGELLGTDRVGVNDDFFALGGHSLLATQAIMRIRRRHGDIPLRALLAAPTVATLAEVVRSASEVPQ